MALSWMVYSKDAAVKFPTISPVITTAFPKFKNQTFFAVAASAIEVTAFQYDNITSYDEYIERTFGRNGKTVLEGAKKYKAVAEYFH